MWIASLLLLVAAGEPQAAAATPLAVPAPPAPIFWRQTLFSIPFHVQHAANAAQEPVEVQLWVSPDRGVHWDNWRQASPQKGYFLFRAGIDGEYWFDVRTVDRAGQVRPQGPHRPQLVVVVDTTPPKVQLTAHRSDDGRVVASFRVDELYLKSDSLTIEYRTAPQAPWQAVGAGAVHINGAGLTGETSWFVLDHATAVQIRLRVSDMAGNTAEGHAQVSPTAPAATPAATALSSGSLGTGGSQSLTPPAARTPWPAENVSRAPGLSVPPASGNGGNGGVSLRINPPVGSQLVALPDRATASTPPPFSEFKPANVSGTRSVPDTMNQFGDFTAAARRAPIGGAAPTKDVASPPGVKLRWINSRAFQLTYDTRTLGAAGNMPVELWGTRDGGQTWQSFGRDPKGQSPMVVTVPEEGIYGFQMMLQNGNGASRPPLSGDVPRTWIGIDCTKPVGRITPAQQGAGRDADKLFISWEASDNRALADKPISLSYSDRPGGPWTTIAAGLENTGQYAWPLKSNLPQRLYLRLEVRDAAGNVGIFETPEPTALDLSPRIVPLGELRPLGWLDARPGQQTYLR